MPLECAVLEFGGRALHEGVWVEFRPSPLEAVSKCRGRTLGGGVGAGLGLCTLAGRLQGQRIRPGGPRDTWCLSGQGKCWPRSLPFLCFPPTVSPRVSSVTAGPLTVGGSRWVQELLPWPSHPSGVPVPEVWPLLLLPLISLPLPQDPCCWRGPWCTEDQARDLNRFLGAPVGRRNLATLPFDPLHSQWFPNFPFGHGIPSPPPATPQGCQSCPPSTSPLPSLLPHPTSYPVTGVSSHPLRCPWSPTGAWQVPQL